MSSPVLANSASQLNGKTLVDTQDPQTITGPWTFNLAPNAPFAVASGSAVVTNLNADLLQGNTVAQILAQAPTVPSGSMMLWPAAASAIPTGWFWCNGQAISRTTYATLFTAVGTLYGSGDGVSTFNVPNMQQSFPLGVAASGTGSTLAGAGGSIDHTHTYTQVINHTHTVSVTDPGHDHTTHGIPQSSVTAGGGSGVNVVINDGNNVSVGANTTGITATTVAPGGGVATGTTALNNPPFIALHYMIKT